MFDEQEVGAAMIRFPEVEAADPVAMREDRRRETIAHFRKTIETALASMPPRPDGLLIVIDEALIEKAVDGYLAEIGRYFYGLREG